MELLFGIRSPSEMSVACSARKRWATLPWPHGEVSHVRWPGHGAGAMGRRSGDAGVEASHVRGRHPPRLHLRGLRGSL
eukprot:300679-Prorocentrum_minimum.AAC.1